jgi:hypothetical protein
MQIATVVVGQQRRGRLDPRQQDAMIRLAKQTPDEKRNEIARIVQQQARLSSDPTALAWSLKVGAPWAWMPAPHQPHPPTCVADVSDKWWLHCVVLDLHGRRIMNSCCGSNVPISASSELASSGVPRVQGLH